MYLHDRLQVCLLALASRYPQHVVDINEDILGFQTFGADGWTSADMIEMFEQIAPELLQSMAHLIIDPQRSAIYLVEQTAEVPAFQIHCRGRLPGCKGNIVARQQIPQSVTVYVQETEEKNKNAW